MDFRYRLAKKTFKNKKIPQKRAAGMDVISQDQRGDDSSPEVSPLSLDRQTITPKPQLPKEEKQLSRRDLFSFGNLMKSAAELDVKPIEETEEEDEGKEEDGAFVVKEELGSQLLKHNPNSTKSTIKFKLGSNKPTSTMDKIMERISNINHN